MSDPADPVTFGALLRGWRLEAELTQAELAALAGLSARGIQNLEHGDVHPRRETAKRLAQALRLDDGCRELLTSAARPRPRRRARDHAAGTGPNGASSAGSGLPRTEVAAPLTPISRFIGRERQIMEVQRLLFDRRLVVLTGVGGCGKTRLALEVAARTRDRFADRVFLVSLASLGDPKSALVPRLVEKAVGHALGLRESPRQTLRRALEATMRQHEMLLVLDNFEHLLEAAPRVAEWLEVSPKLAVLATSRAPLHLPGEQIYPVPTLTLPESSDRAGHSEAVQLFVERAGSVRPGFRLTEANAPAVVEICRQLDGLPLAIELAAARTRLLSPQQIAARLDDLFRLLVGGGRAAPPRQQTLRATLDWSYALLSESERTLLRRLAVFAGGWAIEAAEQVVSGQWPVVSNESTDHWPLVTDHSVLDQLASLVDKSLAVVEEADELVRYRFLETIRRYAGERLREADEEAILRDRHRDWFLAFAEQAEPELFGPEQVRWLDRLEADHGNLGAALRWCVERPDVECGLRFGAALWRFWEGRNHLAEGRAWLEELLALESGPDPTALECRARVAAGRLAFLRGDRAAARRFLESCLVRSRELGELGLLAWTLHQLGHLSRDRGDLAEARAQYDASLRIWRERDDARGIAIALLALGRLALIEGHVDEGLALLEDSLWRYRALGDLTDLTRVLLLLGGAASDLGRVDEARALFTEGLETAASLRDRGRVAANLEGCAILAAAEGQPELAVRLAAMGVAMAESTGTVLAITLDEHRRFEARLGPIRRAVGESRCAELLEQARGMTIDQVIAFARETGANAAYAVNSAADAACGHAGLTARDREVATLVARGLTNPQIAEELVLSPRTAEWRVGRLLARLGLQSRAQVAIWASQNGLAAATDT